jgi:hypothetical protein
MAEQGKGLYYRVNKQNKNMEGTPTPEIGGSLRPWNSINPRSFYLNKYECGCSCSCVANVQSEHSCYCVLVDPLLTLPCPEAAANRRIGGLPLRARPESCLLHSVLVYSSNLL